MNAKRNRSISTQTIALGAVMTALVILLQCIATYTTFFGPFSTAIALVPIIIGAAMCGPIIGAWLGFVFAAVVLLTGGAALFFNFDIVGTYVSVVLKGIGCGLAAGWIYKLLEKYNVVLATVVASIVCPVVNTGIFLLGSAVFFLDSASDIAAAVGSNANGMSVFVGLAFANFLFELGLCLVLSPVAIRVLNIFKKKAN